MTSEERDLITGLFNRLRTADSAAKDQKDSEAEQLIGQLTGSQPGAPYRLVQTLLVQEHALSNATVRIQQLEQQVAQAQKAGASVPSGQGGGGFLSGLFGQHAATPAATQPPPIPPQQLPPQPQAQGYAPQNLPPYPSTVTMAPSGGGGFLRGALQTAAGVAGGALVAQGIENLLGHHAGMFGGGYGGYGGGGGFFGGGGGYGGGEQIVENNTEVVNNNYIDERGSGGDTGFTSGMSLDPVPQQETQREDNRSDGGTFDDASFNTGNPFDAAPANDAGGMAMDNTFDTDNPDADSGSGGDFAGNDDGGSDDSSNV